MSLQQNYAYTWELIPVSVVFAKSYFSCSKIFWIHVSNLSIDIGERPFTCPHCHAAYNTSSKLLKHLRAAHNLRPFACETCGEQFAMMRDLREHSSASEHVIEKKYKCTVCSKMYTRSIHLRLHMRQVHAGIRWFAKNICHNILFADNAPDDMPDCLDNEMHLPRSCSDCAAF